MTIYSFIFIDLLLVLALYLFTLGFMGLISGVPMLHRAPFALNRPTIYVVVLGLLFLDSIIAYFGEVPALIVFVLVALDIVYETIHPFISHSVEVEGVDTETVRADLIDAFQKLNLRYEGKYPRFTLPAQRAKLKVRYWPRLKKAELVIYPRSQMDLLLRIAEQVEADFDTEEGKGNARGYLINILAAFAIFGFVLWQFWCKEC